MRPQIIWLNTSTMETSGGGGFVSAFVMQACLFWFSAEGAEDKGRGSLGAVGGMGGLYGCSLWVLVGLGGLCLWGCCACQDVLSRGLRQ